MADALALEYMHTPYPEIIYNNHFWELIALDINRTNGRLLNKKCCENTGKTNPTNILTFI
jgi:hypothetical protein